MAVNNWKDGFRRIVTVSVNEVFMDLHCFEWEAWLMDWSLLILQKGFPFPEPKLGSKDRVLQQAVTRFWYILPPILWPVMATGERQRINEISARAITRAKYRVCWYIRKDTDIGSRPYLPKTFPGG